MIAKEIVENDWIFNVLMMKLTGFADIPDIEYEKDEPRLIPTF